MSLAKRWHSDTRDAEQKKGGDIITEMIVDALLEYTGSTQRKLAEALGLSPAEVSRKLHHKRSFNQKQILALRRFFPEMPLDLIFDLFYFEKPAFSGYAGMIQKLESCGYGGITLFIQNKLKGQDENGDIQMGIRQSESRA